MKSKMIFGVIAALALNITASFAQDRIVRIGTEGAYPPFNFINDNGEVDGFERELGDEICKRANLECVWVQNDWDSIIPNLVSGNYDAIMAGMSVTAERDEVIDFTSEYYPPDPSYFAAMKGHELNLDKDIIAAQVSTIQAGYVAEKGAELIEFSLPDEVFAAVRNGEADALIGDGAFVDQHLASYDDMAIVGDPIMVGGGIALGIRESDPDLNAAFSKAINSMISDGSLQVILDKWFEGVKIQ